MFFFFGFFLLRHQFIVELVDSFRRVFLPRFLLGKLLQGQPLLEKFLHFLLIFFGELIFDFEFPHILLFLLFLQMFFDGSILLFYFKDTVRNTRQELFVMNGEKLSKNVLDNLSVGKGLEIGSQIFSQGLLTK